MSTARSLPPFLRPDSSWDAATLAWRGTWHRALPDAVADEFLLYLALRPQLTVGTFRWYPARLPRLAAFGRSVRAQLLAGDGVCWLHGLGELELSVEHARCFHLAIGCAIGEPLLQRGELLAGGEPANAHEPPHTDGCDSPAPPDLVGVLCEQAPPGGDARVVVNAPRVREALQREAPDVLAQLERPWLFGGTGAANATTTTPLARLLRNRFPVLAPCGVAGATLRYERAALEHGAAAAGCALDAAAQRVLDVLDAVLAREQHTLRLELEPGDVLWLHNGAMAHANGAGDRANAREQRLWLRARAQPALLRR
jgi:hypothetical protein